MCVYACTAWSRALRQSGQDAINLERPVILVVPIVDLRLLLVGAVEKKKKKKKKTRIVSLKDRAKQKRARIVFSNALERPERERDASVPREVVCRFLRNASPSFLDRQPGNDPYGMVLRAGAEQYTSCAPVRPWGSKVQRRDYIGVRQRTNIHRYFVLTRLYEQSAGAAPRKLFVPQTHLAPFREILLE